MTPEKNSQPYTIRFTRKTEKGWKKLEENSPETLERCRHFLMFSPLDRHTANGKLKKLKGNSHGALQYDVTDSVRVRYWVEQENHIVYVEYAGPHP